MKRFKVLSLAALVAFAACDEGGEPVVPTPVTGTISGVVTIEGTARSGVSVTLSSGAAATTDASGAFSFAAVAAGTYTVSISGFPTDATFTTTTKGATIATSGQVVTVNFDGTYVRTSAILGSVAAGGSGLSGVKVALTGANTTGASVNTDANGQYAFTGLRAGSYTVTISGFDATQYTFASTTSTVTVGVGQSQVASFNGTKLATAKITGTVTIEGAAAAGVTATLSSGATATTDATGAYSFSNLTAGTYSVTISGYPSDATFSSVAQTVTIASAGSTVTANFAGVYVKTSAILGQVSVSGTGLAGVTVTLNTGATVNTDSNGQYSFATLRAGTYTVTISGWNATLYTFATTSADVTVGLGQSAVQNFAGTYVATSLISGSMFIDELPKNDTYDAAEDVYALSGVTVQIEGGLVNDIQTTTTSDGTYSFANLVPGTYRVTFTAPAAGTLAFGGASTQALVTLAPAGAAVVNWPFDIVRQYVNAYAYLGKDADVAAPAGVLPGILPLTGVTLQLYDTYANATAATATGRIGSGTTTATGVVSFNFARAADDSPAGTPDNIVFARYSSVAGTNKLINGETIIEIAYDPTDTLTQAPDTFDFLNTGVILRFDAKQPDGNLLKGWAVALYRNATDTVIAGTALQSGLTNVTTGLGRFVEAYGSATLPDTFYIRLADAGAQAGANLHNFTQTPAPLDGTAGGRFLRYVVNGTNPDSVFVGTQNILWQDQDLYVKAHNEADDTINFTNLDGVVNSTNLDVQVYQVNTDGTKVAVAGQGPFALDPVTGAIVFGINGSIPTRLATGTYEVRARSRVATQTVLADTAVQIVLDGSKQQDTVDAKTASATHPKGYASFSWKYNNTIIAGTVRAADGTNADGITVNIKTASNFIGPVRDTTITIAGGSYSKGGLLEGPYVITASAAGLEGSWQLLVTLAGNTTASTASRETQGLLDDKIASFQATRMDTEVKGVVINDRDMDLSTIDPDEALAGVTVQLYRDGSGTVTLDTLVATATTDANGAFSFSALQEGRYAVKATSLVNAMVLRGLSKDTAVITTAATTVGSGANNTRVVGTTTPGTLPRWDYNNSVADGGYLPASFTFLFTNTIVKGTVKTGAAVAVPGMTISLRRCNVSAGATSPPTGAGTCTTYLGSTVNMVSDANGAFEFSSLIEGVYEIRPQPTTVAGWTTSTPAQILYITVGNADIENYNFVIS